MADGNVQRFSPLLLARLAGVFSLIGIVTGAFDIGYVRSTILVVGNAAQTIQNIVAHQNLVRAGFAAHLVLVLVNIPGEIIFFILFRRVNVVLASVAMACGLIGTAIEALNLLGAYVPLTITLEGGALEAFNPQQLQAFSYLSLRLEDVGLLISFLFYGLDEMLGGFLIFRSAFLPRAVGILYAIAGACYFTHGFMSVIAPALDARLYPYILMPCLPGEGLTSLWFAIFGLNVAKWHGWMSTPRGRMSWHLPAV